MSVLHLVSWNVNGIRAIHRKGFLDWVEQSSPDVICLQETRANLDQLDAELAQPGGYHVAWNSSRAKKGYSGTAILSRREPVELRYGLGDERFDIEGRTLEADYGDFVLLNAYFPNGRRDHSRVPFKLEFCARFLERCEQLRAAGRAVAFCGDLNTSHREIDLARPAANRNTTGFLPDERAWMDEVVEAGWVDSFRHLHPDRDGAYTWWSMPMRARERNIGWRLDYFFVSPDLADRIDGAEILDDVMGSDHCPIELKIQNSGATKGAG